MYWRIVQEEIKKEENAKYPFASKKGYLELKLGPFWAKRWLVLSEGRLIVCKSATQEDEYQLLVPMSTMGELTGKPAVASVADTRFHQWFSTTRQQMRRPRRLQSKVALGRCARVLCIETDAHPCLGTQQWGFTISTPVSKLRLRCKSERERQQWLTALAGALRSAVYNGACAIVTDIARARVAEREVAVDEDLATPRVTQESSTDIFSAIAAMKHSSSDSASIAAAAAAAADANAVLEAAASSSPAPSSPGRRSPRRGGRTPRGNRAASSSDYVSNKIATVPGTKKKKKRPVVAKPRKRRVKVCVRVAVYVPWLMACAGGGAV